MEQKAVKELVRHCDVGEHNNENTRKDYREGRRPGKNNINGLIMTINY